MFNIFRKEVYTGKQLNRSLSFCKEMSFASDAAEFCFRELSKENDNCQSRRLIVFVQNWARALEGELVQGKGVNRLKAMEIFEVLDKGEWMARSEYQFCRKCLILYWKYAEMIMNEDEIKDLENDYIYKKLHTG